MAEANQPFNIIEATIESVHSAYQSGQLTAQRLVQMYLDRIEAFDKKGPAINAIISINPLALGEAERLDAAFKTSGFVGPLHGIPVIMKDQGDAKGMPTTLGSVLFKDYYPQRDAFAVEKLKRAGAVILGKATLVELGGGDTHGSLFGSTRNPYDLERTAGGSSGGSGASVAANYCTVRHRPGGLCIDSAAIDVEFGVRHAPHRRLSQSQRSLRRMAIPGRIPGTDDAFDGRSRQAARCHGRL